MPSRMKTPLDGIPPDGRYCPDKISETFEVFVSVNNIRVQISCIGNIGVLNARFRYNPRDGNNFFIVFNESVNTDRDRITPALPRSNQRVVLLKFDYTF